MAHGQSLRLSGPYLGAGIAEQQEICQGIAEHGVAAGIFILGEQVSATVIERVTHPVRRVPVRAHVLAAVILDETGPYGVHPAPDQPVVVTRPAYPGGGDHGHRSPGGVAYELLGDTVLVSVLGVSVDMRIGIYRNRRAGVHPSDLIIVVPVFTVTAVMCVIGFAVEPTGHAVYAEHHRQQCAVAEGGGVRGVKLGVRPPIVVRHS